MAAAIVVGALFGIAGFLPLVAGLRMTRRVTDTSNLGHAGAAAIACVALARDLVLPFVLAEVAALCIAAVAFGFSKLVRK